MKTLPAQLVANKSNTSDARPIFILNIIYNSLNHYYSGNQFTFNGVTVNGGITNYDSFNEKLSNNYKNNTLSVKIYNDTTLKNDLFDYDNVTCVLYFGINCTLFSQMTIFYTGLLDVIHYADIDHLLRLTFEKETKKQLIGTTVSDTYNNKSYIESSTIIPIVYGRCKRIKAVAVNRPPASTLSLKCTPISESLTITDGSVFAQDTPLYFYISNQELIRGRVIGNKINIMQRELVIAHGYTSGSQPTLNTVTLDLAIPGQLYIGLWIKFIYSPYDSTSVPITNFTLPNIIGFGTGKEVNSGTEYEIYGKATAHDVGAPIMQQSDEYVWAVHDGSNATIDKIEIETSLVFSKDGAISKTLKNIKSYAELNKNDYTINTNDSRFTDHPITTVTTKFDLKLSSNTSFTENDLFVSLTSSISNPITVVCDLLDKLGLSADINAVSKAALETEYSFDKTSLVITNKTDIDIIHDIAFQHDFSVSYINNEFYFNSNLISSSPITIANSDIVQDSFTITTGKRENVINKIIVQYVNKFGFNDELQVKDNASIAKYGIKEKIINLSSVDCNVNRNIAVYLAYRHLYKNSKKFNTISFGTFLKTLELQPNDNIIVNNHKAYIDSVQQNADTFERTFTAKTYDCVECTSNCEAFQETSCLTFTQMSCLTGSEVTCVYACETADQDICKISCVGMCEQECTAFLQQHTGGSGGGKTCTSNSCQVSSCQINGCRDSVETSCYACEHSCVVACQALIQSSVCSLSNELCVTSCVVSCRHSCVGSIEIIGTPCETTCQGYQTACATTTQTSGCTTWCMHFCQLSNETIEQNCFLYCQLSGQGGAVCNTYCEIGSCQVTVTAGCALMCETTTMTYCTSYEQLLGSCSTRCQTYCTLGGGCQTGCTANVTVDETESCLNGTEAACNANCEISCMSSCRADGTETTPWICTTACQAVSCVQYCETSTQGGDFGSGGGSNPCVTACMAACMTSSTTGCGEYCTVGCQCYCQISCESACRDSGCMVNCECACQQSVMPVCSASNETCFASCMSWCQSQNTTTACVQGCQAWAMTSNYEGCNYYCTVGAQCECWLSCEQSCRSGCETKKEAADGCFCATSSTLFDTCTGNCEATCQVACTYSAQGCHEFNMSQCYTQCQVSCTTGCKNHCQTAQQTSACVTGCQAWAMTTAYEACNYYCTVGAQWSCFANCQQSCRNDCMTSKRADCGSNCMTSCQTPVELGTCITACQLSAQPCRSTCETLCQVGCTGGVELCATTCQATCQTVAQTTCLGECETTCQGYCTAYECQTFCTTSNTTESVCATSNTITDCQSTCQITCQLGCTTYTQGGCFGYNELDMCSSTCRASCTTACMDSCRTRDTFSPCASSCRSFCMTGGCTTDCQAFCTVGAQCACFADCQSACREGCEVLCKCTCQLTSQL